jgi:hypothetical protein
MAIIYPAEAERFTHVLRLGNVKADHRDILWESYSEVFVLMGNWDDSCPPRIVRDDQVREV